MPLFYPAMLLALPNTGDSNAGILGFVFAALLVAAVLIVVLIVMGKKNKKRNKR